MNEPLDDLDIYIEAQGPQFKNALDDGRHLNDVVRHLYERRKRKGLSKRKVAKRMMVAVRHVNDIERYWCTANVGLLQRYARAVDARLDITIVDDGAVAHERTGRTIDGWCGPNGR